MALFDCVLSRAKCTADAIVFAREHFNVGVKVIFIFGKWRLGRQVCLVAPSERYRESTSVSRRQEGA